MIMGEFELFKVAVFMRKRLRRSQICCTILLSCLLLVAAKSNLRRYIFTSVRN